MERTPKVQRKNSFTLSVSRRRNRFNASSQRCLTDTNCVSDEPSLPCASVASVCSEDGGVGCTPPNTRMRKKPKPDETIDSPKPFFDTSFSPSGMLSQTLAIESPEVDWRWGQRITGTKEDASVTPDSAYADSSFTSAGSNSVKAATIHKRGELLQQRSAYDQRREEQRIASELQVRRAKKTRAHEVLKKRCARLEEQLRYAESQRLQHKENATSPIDCFQKNFEIAASSKTQRAVIGTKTDEIIAAFKSNDTTDDFFNDSMSDCLLIQATQELESEIVEPQKPAGSDAIVAATSKSSGNGRKKRSSLYIKFLEDDSPDDWFASLDEVIWEATQTKKSRTSLQRHHSMPAPTLVTATASVNKATIYTKATTTKTIATMTRSMLDKVTKNDASSRSCNSGCGAENVSKMKRHASNL